MIDSLITVGYGIAAISLCCTIGAYFVIPKIIRATFTENEKENDDFESDDDEAIPSEEDINDKQ